MTKGSYFIIKPESGYIAQLDIFKPNNHGWYRLLYAIQSISLTIKINNVDEREIDKVKALKNIGLENLIDQYEIELIMDT